ncbi:MAG: hypothetical protein FWC36_02495 [Spirochaetes bacterium]|nr:hypothetical protein [Spirochaetota bacterium]
MNNNLTEIVAILDRSGSMEHLTNDTIGGFNNFLKQQKNIPGEAILTTVLFNNSYKLLHDRLNIKNVNPITSAEYIAEGNTALLDAIGKTIHSIGSKLHNTAKDERPGKVIFFIITDGEENASIEYTNEKIKEMVELQKNTYSWEFIFLGANIDSFSAAASIGISADRAFDFEAEEEGMYAVQAAMSAAVSNLRMYDAIDAEEAPDFRQKIKKPKK